MIIYVLILIVLGLITGAIFLSFNHGIIIQFISLGFANYEQVPLNLIVLYSVLFGFVYALLFAIGQEIRLRARVARLKNENRHLLEELDTLRTAPLEELLLEEDDNGK